MTSNRSKTDAFLDGVEWVSNLYVTAVAMCVATWLLVTTLRILGKQEDLEYLKLIK